MSISRRTKIALLVLVLVAVSGFAGFVLGAIAAKGVANRKDDPRFWKRVAMRKLESLEPTDEQRARMEKRVDAAVEELTGIRKETVQRAEEAVARAVADIAAELTPKQREQFDKIKPRSKTAGAE
jgi:Spy/CpxP family protein refolding chaperone